MVIYRMQGVGFQWRSVWIPLKAFFAQGPGYTASSRAQSLNGRLLVVTSDHRTDREREKNFLLKAFQPPQAAIKAPGLMRVHAACRAEIQATARINVRATVWPSDMQ